MPNLVKKFDPVYVYGLHIIYLVCLVCVWEHRIRFLKGITSFAIWLIRPRRNRGTLALVGSDEIYNLGRPFLGHHYFILSLPNLCLGEERRFFKKWCINNISRILPHTSIRTPVQEVIKFIILVDSSLVTITIHLVYLVLVYLVYVWV